MQFNERREAGHRQQPRLADRGRSHDPPYFASHWMRHRPPQKTFLQIYTNHDDTLLESKTHVSQKGNKFASLKDIHVLL